MADKAELRIELVEDGQAAGRAPPPAGAPPSPPPGGTAPPAAEAAEAGAAGKAAGAAGAAAAIAGAIKDRVGKAWKGIKEAAPQAAEAGQALAQNDNLTAIGASAKGAASALEGLSAAGVPLAGTLGVLAKGVGKAVDAVKPFADVVNAFVARARQLSQFSPDLAMSTARADVTSMLADIREAQELGPDLARLQDAQTDLIDTVKDFLLPLKRFVVEVLADAMEKIIEWIKDTRAFASFLDKYRDELFTLIRVAINPFATEASRKQAQDIIANAIRAERLLMEAERAAGGGQELFDRQMKDMRGAFFNLPRAVVPGPLGLPIPPGGLAGP